MHAKHAFYHQAIPQPTRGAFMVEAHDRMGTQRTVMEFNQGRASWRKEMALSKVWWLRRLR
jgi:hypothetical protein